MLSFRVATLFENFHRLTSTSQGAGYGVVIGLGALFALGMIAISEVMKRRGNVENSEEFTGTWSCTLYDG